MREARWSPAAVAKTYRSARLRSQPAVRLKLQGEKKKRWRFRQALAVRCCEDDAHAPAPRPIPSSPHSRERILWRQTRTSESPRKFPGREPSTAPPGECSMKPGLEFQAFGLLHELLP